MKFSHSSNVRDIVKQFDLAAAQTRTAVTRALNKTTAQAKVRAAREVRDAGYKLKISEIKDAIKQVKATSSRFRSNIVTTGRPIALIKYGARDVKPNGVRVDVLNGRKTIANAFIAQTKNGPQVFIREPGAKHKKVIKNGKAQWSALPIRKLYGPSIPDAMGNALVSKVIIDLITERFPIIFESEHAWLASGLPKRRAPPTD